MTEKRKLWFVRETSPDRTGKGGAFLYSKLPIRRHPISGVNTNQNEDYIWIPQSIVEHRTKIGNEHIVTLPNWFCEKEKL